ncbi:MAG: hypothetical protein KGL67_02955 [Patescibacteria group bacterium]|nr:hypothetical protein [Patescibacteria group bacterium]
MAKNKISITVFILSIAGLLFSGYLSGVKFFTSTCAFNEGCPFFLGYPACYFGFGMFLLITIFSSLLVFSKIEKRKALLGLSMVSFLGMLFAGYFTFKEIPILFQQGLGAYIFGLPTCALGLIFYVLIFVLSTYFMSKEVAIIK